MGFSLLQPQNDPKKCLYLVVAHSTPLVIAKSESDRSQSSDKDSNDASQTDDESNRWEKILNLKLAEYKELKFLNSSSKEDLDKESQDEEVDYSFILLYQIMFEKCVNIFLNQNESYFLYEVCSQIKKNIRKKIFILV